MASASQMSSKLFGRTRHREPEHRSCHTVISTSAGQQIITGGFTKTDGTTATLANLNLHQDNFHSEYTDQVEIPEALQGLPDLHGMGGLRDLKEAAALSPPLARCAFPIRDSRDQNRTKGAYRSGVAGVGQDRPTL